MDGRSETELDRDELIALVREVRRELAAARDENSPSRKRIEQLEGRSPTTRLVESYSLQSEQRQQASRQQKKRKQNSSRRGRRTDLLPIVVPPGVRESGSR